MIDQLTVDPLVSSLGLADRALLSQSCRGLRDCYLPDVTTRIEQIKQKKISWDDLHDYQCEFGPKQTPRLLSFLSESLKSGLGNERDIDLLQLVREDACDQIKVLHLGKCEISDRGLQAIAQRCSNLVAVCLAQEENAPQQITDEGIRTFVEACPTLRRINLRGRTLFSDEVIHELMQNRQWGLFAPPGNDSEVVGPDEDSMLHPSNLRIAQQILENARE